MTRCTFKQGNYNCGSYAFNLYKEDIDQGSYCDRHYWQDQAQNARAAEREAWQKQLTNAQRNELKQIEDGTWEADRNG